jgi:hypothetical protein
LVFATLSLSTLLTSAFAARVVAFAGEPAAGPYFGNLATAVRPRSEEEEQFVSVCPLNWGQIYDGAFFRSGIYANDKNAGSSSNVRALFISMSVGVQTI